MYGEPSRIREVAQRLERRAAQLRQEAHELLVASDTLPWVSVAADRMRQQACSRRDELLVVAREYDEAADRVRAHAAEVQRLLDLIEDIERQARAIIGEAVARARDAASAVADGIKDALTPGDLDDQRIAETPCPPSGHRAWLEVPDLLPGVGA